MPCHFQRWLRSVAYNYCRFRISTDGNLKLMLPEELKQNVMVYGPLFPFSPSFFVPHVGIRTQPFVGNGTQFAALVILRTIPDYLPVWPQSIVLLPSRVAVKTSSEGIELGASIFLNMVPDASGTDERHPRWIGFIHRFEKGVDDLYFVVRAKRTQVETHQKGGSQSIVLERGIYHYVRKDPLAIGFILHKETSYVIQVLDAPLRIVHERDDFQQHQRRR
jgi:hypothetical protein